MKVLVLLSLLGLVAAEPQLILPYSSPLLTPTFRTTGSSPLITSYSAGSTPVINTYTASYPYTGFPSIQAALPSTYSYPFLSSPIITTGSNPTTVVSSRQKRSAEPEPEADPSILYTSGVTTNPAAINYPWALPTTIPLTSNIGYTGLPAAVTTYSNPPQTIPTTAGITYTTPFTGIPTTGNFPVVSPYSAFPYLVPVVPATKAETTPEGAEAPKPAEITRAKRSAEADPEADPQLLTTGFTGFTYPAINTRTTPTALTYTGLPATSTALTYTTLPRTTWPTTYTSGFPITYGTYPTGTTYIAGI